MLLSGAKERDNAAKIPRQAGSLALFIAPLFCSTADCAPVAPANTAGEIITARVGLSAAVSTT